MIKNDGDDDPDDDDNVEGKHYILIKQFVFWNLL